MGFLSKIKKNEVKFGLENYVFLIRGAAKAGKSSFFAQIVEEMYGDSTKGLLIPFEKGYSAINGVNIFPYTIVPEMMIDEETYRGWEVFTQLVDEIINTPEEDRIKIVAIDTVDEFINVAIDETCRLSRIKTKKPCDSIDQSWGGFGRGRAFMKKMIKEQIEKLRGAGVGIFFIGHTKVKTLKTKIDEEEYQILGSNLTEDYDAVFANDADFILMITNDNKVVDGRMITGERYLRFRGDGFYAAGSRFANVPEQIPLDAKVFIQTLKNCVMGLANIKDMKTMDKLVEQEQKENKVTREKNKKASEEKLNELLTKIKQFGASDDTPIATKTELMGVIGEYEIDMKNPLNNNITSLQEIIDRFGI